MPPFGDYQNEIYLAGLRGVVPALPVDYARLEARAEAAMDPLLLGYVQGGCGDGTTQRRNAEAFGHWGMTPRMLIDTSVRDLSVELFGARWESPLFLSPIGVIGLCAADGHGDIAAARAAAQARVPFIASTLATDPIEAVGAALGGGLGFFQLYTPKDKALAESFVRRAEAAGFRGLVVTLDTCVTGWRPRDLNAAFLPQLRGTVLANYVSDPVFRASLERPPEEDRAAVARRWAAVFGAPLAWSDLPWLRSLTRLPLILKGICHPDDARRAIDGGADAIYCSNHGGRQANGGIAAIDLLPGVVAACGDVPVLFDSGVRSGTDMVKAVALGARAVGVGRPYAYGVALGGSEGCVHVLRCLQAEADLLMAVNGWPTLAAVREAGAVRI